MTSIAELHGRAVGVRVSKVLPCENDYIVLLDYCDASQANVTDNLRRLRSDGEVVWAATAPNYSDIYINVEWQYGRLMAWTFGCYMVTVDPKTGRSLEKVFTK
jgi:hypothetical protein